MMHTIYFVPLSKYDTVIEKPDGTVEIPPHRKLHYVCCSHNKYGIFIFNTEHLFVARYDFEKETLFYLSGFDVSFIKKQHSFGSHPEYLAFYDRIEGTITLTDLNGSIQQTYACPRRLNCFTFIDTQHIWCVDSEDRLAFLIELYSDHYQIIKKFPIKGIGDASILVLNDSIHITDSEENIIRCYHAKTGKLIYEAITPFIDPIGQLFYNHKHYILYSGLENEVGYENRCWQEQRPFFHELKTCIIETDDYIITRSNGFLLDFYYEEHIVDPFDFEPVRIRLKLPENTLHQHVQFVEPLGIAFSAQNKAYAEITIDRSLRNIQRFGYRARIETVSIKFTPKHSVIIDQSLLLDQNDIEHLQADDTFFDFFIIPQKPHSIEHLLLLRNKIFERMEYKKNTYAVNFKEIWQDGYGTCGDYASLMLIACYKNQMACQSATGYKVPRFYFRTKHPYSVYYNHTWLEFQDTKGNIIPFESSSDDKKIDGRFCEGQFLGLDWSHVKLYNGKAFPNLISFPDHPGMHPFDYLGHPMVYVKIIDEIEPDGKLRI